MTLIFGSEKHILKDTFWKSRISKKGWWINREWKGCESIGYWTRYVILSYDLGFSMSDFKIKFWKSCIPGMGWSIDMDWKGCESIGSRTDPPLWLSTLTSPVTLTLDFQYQIFKKLCLRNGRVNWYGMKGHESIGCWTHYVTWALILTLDFQGQIVKQPYRKKWTADWHGSKGMSGFLDPLWPWPLTFPMTLDWIFRVKFWNSHILRMEGSIDLEWKGCESGTTLDPL